MTEIVCLHSKAAVATFCRQNPLVYLYALGDLDDFHWRHTTWLALADQGTVRQLALLYYDPAMRLPTLLALAHDRPREMEDLLRAALPVLPRRFHAHLMQSVTQIFASEFTIHAHGDYLRMGLMEERHALTVDASAAVALRPAAAAELDAFYAASYPGHWFVPRMLETGFYFGMRRGPTLASVAGVHTSSLEYQVAALGNITTLPELRGQGLATVATARVCQELRRAGIEHIGLNVKADNESGIACYRKLGFEPVVEYGEYTLEAR